MDVKSSVMRQCLTKESGSVGRLGDGAALEIDAVLEHGFNLEEDLVFGVEVVAVLYLAKGSLKDSEALTCLKDVKEILGFDTAHGGEPLFLWKHGFGNLLLPYW